MAAMCATFAAFTMRAAIACGAIPAEHTRSAALALKASMAARIGTIGVVFML